MSRAKSFSEKRERTKGNSAEVGRFFSSILLGDAGIPYSLSRKWRTINETSGKGISNRFVA